MASLRQSRYWFLPALTFGAISIIAFGAVADLPGPDGGGPPILDLRPLLYNGVAIVALLAAIFALVLGAQTRKRHLEQQATSPKLAVAIVRDR